ncbi:carbon storage regulator [Zhongshania aliphaticivorans]|uniref:carbon storage regulator n=1 Tax=Zhongshania aliphaticivorans TaxID=1470434 RepID=UPI0039E2551B
MCSCADTFCFCLSLNTLFSAQDNTTRQRTCLQLKSGESFFIGDDITVHIRHIKNGAVRVSIDAPHELDIQRHQTADTAPPLIEVVYLEN